MHAPRANPTTSQTLRAGGLQALSVFFRFDLFFPTLDPTFQSQAFVREGHWFFQALNPLPLRPLVSAVQGSCDSPRWRWNTARSPS